MSAGALRQIFALFDVQTGDAETKLDKLNDKTNTVKAALGALAGTMLGAFSLHGIASFIEEQIALGGAVGDVADRLGMASAEVQKFQYAASQIAGVAGDDAAKALGTLNRNIGEAIGGSKEAAKQFAGLDVALKDNEGNVRELGDVVPEIADAFSKMGSDQERAAAATKMFGKAGAALLPMLRGGSDAVRELNEQFDELGLGLDEDFLQKADAAGDRIETMKLGFRALKTRIAAEMLPSLTDAMKKFSAWIAWGQKVTRETHIVKEAWWGLGITSAIVAAKMIHSWGKVLGLLKGGSPLANLFSLGKLGLTIGAVLLLAGAIEDIIVMCQGGESVIGDFLESMLGVEEKTKLVESLNQAWQDVQVSIGDVGPALQSLGNAFAATLPWMVALVVDVIKVVATLAIQLMGLGEYLGNIVKGDWNRADEVAGETADKTANIWKTGSTVYNLATAPPTAPAPAYGAGLIGPPQPVEINVENNFEINGAASPGETGRRVAGFQRDVNQQAVDAAANALANGTE